MEEIVCIDKPKGISSAQAVAIAKRLYGAKKAGHAGTLDPAAEGLLIVGLNSGTKKLTEYLKLPKTYEAQILLGKRTDTGDLEGKVLAESAVPEFSLEKIQEVLSSMIGEITLPVPIYSALKRNGKPLYARARAGERVEAPLRSMQVYAAKPTDISVYENKYTKVCVLFDVGSGAYIRSLAEEVGRRLGVPATLAGLRRTRIGDFSLEGAVQI